MQYQSTKNKAITKKYRNTNEIRYKTNYYKKTRLPSEKIMQTEGNKIQKHEIQTAIITNESIIDHAPNN